MNRTTKLLGAWGGVAALGFGLIGELQPAVGVLGLIGNIVVLVALFRAAAELQRPAMRNAIIVSLVLGVLAAVAFLILAGAAAFEMIKDGTPDKLPPEMYQQVGLGAVAGWLLFCAGAWYWFRALSELGQASGVPLFRRAGLVYFVGALSVILVVGLFGLLAAQVMQVAAFFKALEPAGGEALPPRTGGWGPKV
jgi:uncharacterized membrane protein